MPSNQNLVDKLIEKEVSAKTGRLDLGCCGLYTLPDNLQELDWLQELILANQWINPNTHEWVFSSNRGKDNQLTELPQWLENLANLENFKHLWQQY